MALSEFEKFYNNNKKKEASGLDAFFQNLPKNNPAPVLRQPIQQTPAQPVRQTRMSSYLGDKVNDFTRKSDTMYNRGAYNVNAWQKQYEDIVSNIDRQANKYDSSYIDALKERLAQQREKMIPSQLNVPAYKNTGNGYEPANITLNNQNLFKAQEKPFRETTTFDRLMDLAAEKARNNQMIQDTAYVNASGQGFEGMRDRDIRFYQNMWKQQQDEFGRKASTWNPPKKDSPVNYTGKVDLTYYMTDAEIEEFNKSKDKEKYLRDIGIAQGGIDAIMSDTIKTTGGGSDFATTDYTQDRGPMPRLWQNTGIYGNARNMADLEMRSRDIQRKYVGYTLNPDFDENSRYVPEAVTKDLRQLEAINPEMVNNQDEYNAIRHEAINGNQDAIYYLTHVREAGALDDEYSEDPFVEQYMTDEEREKYNYLWNKPETRPQAIELLDDLNLDLWKRAYYAADAETRARLEKMPGWALVLESGIMAGIGLVENQANAVLAAEDILSGRDINPFRMTNKAAITNEVTDTRVRDWAVRNGLGDVGETALSILYQGYYSGLQSTMALGFGSLASDALGLLGQGATQAFSLGLMSTGAGMQTLQQELIAGVPQDRAIVDSLAAGVIEFATEKIGMDNLFNNLIRGKGGFIELLKQAFAEGAEELVGDAASDAFGDIYDLLKDTNYSELNRQANAYLLENGLAPNQRNEAMAHVLAERLQEYATDYAVGFASTGTGEGSFAAISNYNNARVLTGHINERMAPDIFRVAMTLDHDSKAYKGAMALQERMMNEFNPVSITPKEVRKVARDIVYEVRSIENDNERQAKEQDMLEAFGISRFLHPDVHTTTEQPRTVNDPNAGEFEVNKTKADAVKAAEDAEQKRIDDATVNDIITDAVNNNTDKDPDEITRKVTAFRTDGNVEEVSDILTQEQIQTVMEISSREGSAEAVQAAVDAIAEEAVPVQREEAPTEAVEEAIEEEPTTEQEQPAAEQEQSTSEPDTSAFANTLSPKARQAYEETLAEARQKGMSAADATQAFMEVYTAGTHKVAYTPTVNNQKLSPRLRWSIDYAAQQESAEYTANLEQKGFAKSAAAGTQVQTSKGLVATPVLARAVQDGRISQRTADVMNKMGQMLGVRINVLSTNPKYNGEYKAQQADINLYLDAKFFNSKTTDEAVIGVLGHELSHRLEDISPEAYRQLTTMVMQTMGSSGFARMVQHNMRLAPGMTILDAQGEVVSDFVGTMLFRDSDFADRFIGNVQVQTAEQRTALQGLRDFVHKVIDWIRGNKDAFKEPEKTITWMEKLENTLTNLINQSAAAVGESTNVVTPESVQAMGIAIDETSESAFPTDGTRFSQKTWNESDYVTQRDKAARDMAKALDISEKKAKAYIDTVNGVAKYIADNATRLDYIASNGGSAFVSNSEYGGSFDFTTMCKKARLFMGTFSAVQRQLGNNALTANEVLELRDLMKKKGYEVTCGCCYVEGSRANEGQFALKFMELYGAYYPDNWQPELGDLNTPDGIEWTRINHPECYEQYMSFWNNHGKLRAEDPNLFASQQKPKMYQARTAYNGEILTNFKKAETIDQKNHNGGIRMQSFSDFEIVHLIDVMQTIMDMSRVGLAGQAYTKVYDFADAFGDTGLKINLSLIAKGVDENGDIHIDPVEGMKKEDAIKLRNKYSDNVGTIIVCFNDAEVLAAMKSDFIDFIIPFHRSQWKKSQYGLLGLPEKVKDYTNQQNEKLIQQTYHMYQGRMVKDKASNFMPNNYWDFSLSGKENAERYLRLCAENNKRPKFYKFLTKNADGSYALKADGSTDGYWKLLIDFKMYNNDGVGVPQMPVTPNFSMDEINNMLQSYEGGHSSFPVANNVVEEFTNKYKNDHDIRYSTRDAEAIELSDAEVRYSIREEAPPKKTGIAYKVFLAKDGQLYPPMVANPGGEGTPVGVWLNADVAPMAGLTKTGRPQVQAGGKGTNVGKQTLAFRPGWHLGDVPVAKQFGKLNPATGQKDLFPSNFVWAECEYAMDVDYQDKADQMGYMRTSPDGTYYKTDKYQHSLAGLKELPKDGYYHYRTNPNPDTVPWVITGAMKVNKILDDEEVAEICRANGVEPMQRQGGPIDLRSFGLDGTRHSTRDASWLDGLIIDDIIAEIQKNLAAAENKKAQRRVDEVNKRLKQIGLQFTGTKEAAWTDERIDMYLGGGWYGVDGIPNYAQAHIAYMTPQQYLNLTMGTNTATVDRIENETAEYGEVDFNKLGDSAPIRLYIDKGRNGARVTGHEGRHRMMMLGRAGFSRVPVLLFDSSDKYEKTILTNYTLRPQTFGSDKLISRGRNVTLDEMIPFSQGNRDLIKEKFGSGNVNADVRYSLRDTEAPDDFLSIVERNQQREQTRMFLDASADWRQEQTRLDVHKLRGSTEAMLKTYGDKLTRDQKEKLFKSINSLAYDVLRKNGNVFEIEQKATRIAGDIVFQAAGVDGKASRAVMMNDPQTEEAIDYLTNYILANIVSTQTQQGKKLQEQIEKNAKLKETLREVRQKRDAKIREGIESRKRQQTARQDSALRKSILARAKRLKNMKMGQAGKALLQQLIGDMNTDVSHLTEGKIAKIDEVNAWLATQDENNINLSESTKKLLALANQKYLDDIIAKGDVEKLRQLNEALAELEHMVRNQNRLIAENDRRDLREIAYEEADIINNSAGTKEGLFRKIDSVMVQGTLSPMRFVRRLTGYNEKSALYKLAKAIDAGTLKQQDYQMRASKLFDKWMRDRNLTRKWAGKKADIITYDVVTFDGQRKQIQMTPAMRMTLYLASQDAGWMRHMVGADGPDGHIDGAGIHMPNMSSYKKGDMAAAYSAQPDDSHKFRVTKAFLNKIAADLTDEERAFADAAQKFFNGMQKEEINAVSNELVGRDLAVVENYLPIDVDKNFTGVDYGAIQNDGTVAGIGNLKERQSSGAPVYVRDLTDILIKSINSTSAYVGLAIPIRNMNKLLGVNLGSMTEGGQYLTHETSLNEAIDKKWGQTAKDYINKMLSDIQHPVRVQEDLEKAFAKLRSNYARSVLTLNLSVGLKQAASYPTAAAVVGWEALAKAMKDLHKVDLDLIAKYTPLLWYRSRGFINPDLEGIKNQNDFFSNLPRGLDWITGVDFLTTRKLWKAAEYYVRNNQPNLYHKGAGIYGQTDAYNEAVAEVYNRIIEETQPNYTPWQRPQYLRSNSGIVRTLMMFKTQPMQNFNILYDAVGNFKAKQRAMKANSSDPQVQAQFKDASRNLRRAITSQIGQLITFAAMTMAWNLFRRKKEKYEDEEGNFSIETMLKSMGKDIGSGLFGMVPFGADAWSLISSLAFGDKYYGFESVTDSALGDLGSAFKTTWDTISKMVTSGEPFDITTYKKKIKTVGTAVAKIFGIPAENIYNLFTALYMRGRDLTENQYMADYYALAWAEDPSTNKKQFVRVAFQAYMDGDVESFDAVKQALIEDFGFSETDDINEKLKELYKEKYAADPDHALMADAYQHLLDLYTTDKAAYEKEYQVMRDLGFTEKAIKDGVNKQIKAAEAAGQTVEEFKAPGDKLTQIGNEYNSLVNGNVDYNKRPLVDAKTMRNAGWYDVEDGDAITTYTQGYITTDFVDNGSPVSFDITPIRENGNVLSPNELEDYIRSLDLTNGSDALLKSDTLKLIVNTHDGEWDESYWGPLEEKLSEIKEAYETERNKQIKSEEATPEARRGASQNTPREEQPDYVPKKPMTETKKEDSAPVNPIETYLPVMPQKQTSNKEVMETTSNTASWQGDATYNSMFQMLTIPMSGRTYTYFDVPQEVFDGMKNADNPTAYYNQYIKGSYRYTRS